MTAYYKWTFVLALAVGLLAFTPGAQAQIFQQKMTVTFSQPVEIPGQVLPAGSYIFDAIESGHLTRILNADETHIYATLFTVPEELQDTMDKGTVMMKENIPGAPERVDAWFLPGESVGSEFLYSKPSTPEAEHQISMLGGVVRETGHGVKEIGRTTEHIVVNSGTAVAHAGKYLVS